MTVPISTHDKDPFSFNATAWHVLDRFDGNAFVNLPLILAMAHGCLNQLFSHMQKVGGTDRGDVDLNLSLQKYLIALLGSGSSSRAARDTGSSLGC